jgi:hypothetical protein
MKKVMVLSIGVVKPTSGVTEHGWSMYDMNVGVGQVTLAGGFLLYHANADDFVIGEDIELISNDTSRKLKISAIRDQAPATRDAVLEMLLKNGYDYYPARAFKKKRFSSKLTSSYSVKGIQ